MALVRSNIASILKQGSLSHSVILYTIFNRLTHVILDRMLFEIALVSFYL